MFQAASYLSHFLSDTDTNTHTCSRLVYPTLVFCIASKSSCLAVSCFGISEISDHRSTLHSAIINEWENSCVHEIETEKKIRGEDFRTSLYWNNWWQNMLPNTPPWPNSLLQHNHPKIAEWFFCTLFSYEEHILFVSKIQGKILGKISVCKFFNGKYTSNSK